MANPESQEEQRTPTIFRFPDKIGVTNELRRYMTFTVYSFKKEGPELPYGREELLRIILPMPASIGNNMGVGYVDDPFGVVSDKILTALSKEGLGDMAGAVGEEIKKAVSDVGDNGKAVATALFGLGDTDRILRRNGLTVNPNLLSQFTGMSFKFHQFSWKMIARNPSDMRMIANIIAAFQYHAAADQSDVFIKAPDKFLVEFKPDSEGLFKIGMCSLVEFSALYNGSGQPIFFKDTDSPVEVDLQLTLKEDTLPYKGRLKGQFRRMGVYSGDDSKVSELPDI